MASAQPESEDKYSTRRRSGGEARRRQESLRREGQKASGKGSYDAKTRRRGRPAWQRSPDDTPLRDGNRDRVVGLLTDRATRTLIYYLSETNVHTMHWLSTFLKNNPIPRDGAWDDVSGETFLRKLLSMPPEQAKYDVGRDSLFDNIGSLTVDPRQIAQRIMDIRVQVAQELAQDLMNVQQENADLLRETLVASLSIDEPVDHPDKTEAILPAGSSFGSGGMPGFEGLGGTGGGSGSAKEDDDKPAGAAA